MLQLDTGNCYGLAVTSGVSSSDPICNKRQEMNPNSTDHQPITLTTFAVAIFLRTSKNII
jgi:hypothetical protein